MSVCVCLSLSLIVFPRWPSHTPGNRRSQSFVQPGIQLWWPQHWFHGPTHLLFRERARFSKQQSAQFDYVCELRWLGITSDLWSKVGHNYWHDDRPTPRRTHVSALKRNVCVCLYVCVCVWKKERGREIKERQREKERERKREKEREIESKI